MNAVLNAHESGDVRGLLLAGGDGTRIGGVNKAFLRHSGTTLLEIALLNMARNAGTILVGLRAAHYEDDRRVAQGIVDAVPALEGRTVFLPGGATRRETFARLLEQAAGGWTLVHDVARPFAEEADFEAVLAAARAMGENGAAALGRRPQSRDGLGLMQDSRDGTSHITAMLPRAGLVSVQTPQAYRTALLRAALEHDDRNGANENNIPGLVTALGHVVRIVWGRNENQKITYPPDTELLLPDAR